MKWSRLRPLFQSMFFSLGPQEIRRKTGLAMGTIYKLVEDQDAHPHPRTVRDVMVALEEWQPGIYETEQASR
ncbi:MAG TPA: hypothetical protein VM223_13005 [Planctomycetota bacterium]|nr:hypothetical protein [Planctomycetota bacterium]